MMPGSGANERGIHGSGTVPWRDPTLVGQLPNLDFFFLFVFARGLLSSVVIYLVLHGLVLYPLHCPPSRMSFF